MATTEEERERIFQAFVNLMSELYSELNSRGITFPRLHGKEDYVDYSAFKIDLEIISEATGWRMP